MVGRREKGDLPIGDGGGDETGDINGLAFAGNSVLGNVHVDPQVDSGHLVDLEKQRSLSPSHCL